MTGLVTQLLVPIIVRVINRTYNIIDGKIDSKDIPNRRTLCDSPVINNASSMSPFGKFILNADKDVLREFFWYKYGWG